MNNRKIWVILSFIFLSILITGCNQNRNDILEKDMYELCEVITIDYTASDIDLSKRYKYVSVYKFENEKWNKVDAITIDEGVVTYIPEDPGLYRFDLKHAELNNNDIYVKLTVKDKE